MANNRLYIVNTETKEYVCIAKHLGAGWRLLDDVPLLEALLSSEGFGDDLEGNTPFVIGTENDDAFFEAYIKEGINVNAENAWEYAAART